MQCGFHEHFGGMADLLYFLLHEAFEPSICVSAPRRDRRRAR